MKFKDATPQLLNDLDANQFIAGANGNDRGLQLVGEPVQTEPVQTEPVQTEPVHPWQEMDPDGRITSGLTMRLSDYELSRITSMAALRDTSAQKLLRKLVLPAIDAMWDETPSIE